MLKLAKAIYKTSNTGATYYLKRLDKYVKQSESIDKELDPFREAMRLLEELLDYRDDIDSSSELSEAGKKAMLDQIDAKIALVEAKWTTPTGN